MTDLFDGLPDIFVETFGELVDYTPAATGVMRTLQAVWVERSEDAGLGDGVDVDICTTRLHVREADVPDPQEGDLAQRRKTGRSLQVSPPILPDGQGMIACALVEA